MSAFGCVPSCTTRPSLHPLYPTLPACNVTIHNRCKDTLANCTKVKQKVRWQGGPRAGGEGSEYAVPSYLFHSFPTLCSLTPVLAMGSPDPHPQTSGPQRASLWLEAYLPSTGLSHPDALRGPAAQLLPCARGGDSRVTAVLGISLLLCLTATESCAAEEQYCLAVCFAPQ